MLPTLQSLRSDEETEARLGVVSTLVPALVIFFLTTLPPTRSFPISKLASLERLQIFLSEPAFVYKPV